MRGSIGITGLFVVTCVTVVGHGETQVDKRLTASEETGESGELGRPRAAQILADSFENGQPGLRTLSSASRQAARTMGEQTYQGRRLVELAELLEASGPSTIQADRLVNELRELMKDLTFEPVIEASLPADFPAMTPIWEIELKQYPPYRMARTSMQEGTQNANDSIPFYRLFRHIRKNNISMTTPVEIGYDNVDGSLQEASMAFVYEHPKLGSTGTHGSVEVIDVAEQVVLSIGHRGWESQQTLTAAQRRFEEWLQSNADRFEADGPMRIMSWNSPFVPKAQSYYEIQKPVKKTSK